MATRFEKVDDESIEEFLTELNKNENTTKRPEYQRNVFEKVDD